MDRSERLHGIDALRGVVMVLMALDHTRDYFGNFAVDPVDLDTTTPALFFTRWVTHFCAPVFVLLAGSSAWLYGARRTRAELARFLATRGAWLVLLELTVIYFAWTHSFAIGMWFWQVVAAIGTGMVLLAGLLFVPRALLAGVAVGCVAGHNLLDGATGEDFGGWLWVWAKSGSMPGGPIFFEPLGGVALLVVYPILPWLGVLLLGYLLGPVFAQPRASRRRVCLLLGAAATLLFVVLRSGNVYGDPGPWQAQETPVFTVMAFLNCEKYPPSLLYLLMTLGPSLLLLALLDRTPRRLGRAFVHFGRVPLFYYVLHLYLIHGASRVFYAVGWGEPYSALGDGLPLLFTGQPLPEWYGRPLGVVYAAWVLAVLALYLPCRWFSGVKQRSRSAWLSYL